MAVKWIVLLVICEVALVRGKMTKGTDESTDSELTLVTLVKELKENFATINSNVENVIKRLDTMEDSLQDVKHRVTVLEVDNPEKKRKHAGKSDSQAAATTAQFSSFGCASDVISLNCTEGRTIFVISTLFGQYNYPCSDACCPPHPFDDCSQDAEETRPSDWLALKLACDNQTSCAYQYLGVLINDCAQDYLADYMRIFYTCLPVSLDAPVGFTAYPSSDRKYATTNELVLYDTAITNFGGHYQADNSIFICPFDGIYMFSVGVLSRPGFLMSAELSINNVRYIFPYGDNSDNVHNHASGMVFEFCNAGSQVWVAARGSNLKMRGVYKHSLFSAFLLYRYE